MTLATRLRTHGPFILLQAVTAAGPATLDVRLATLLPTSNIWAVISDVSPDGQSHPMAVGRLNTGFPDVVASKSLFSAGQLVQPYGDYLGYAVSSGGTNYAIWGEGISYAGPGGSWFTHD